MNPQSFKKNKYFFTGSICFCRFMFFFTPIVANISQNNTAESHSNSEQPFFYSTETIMSPQKVTVRDALSFSFWFPPDARAYSSVEINESSRAF